MKSRKEQESDHDRGTHEQDAPDFRATEPAVPAVSSTHVVYRESGEPEAHARSAAARRMPPPLPHARAFAHIDDSHDPALSAVERPVTSSVPPTRRTGAVLGWSLASILLVGAGAHYLLVDRPLQQQDERAQHARARQFELHAAELAELKSNLEHMRTELEQANVKLAAQQTAIAEAAAAAENAAAEEAANEAAARAQHRGRSAERSGRRARPAHHSAARRPAQVTASKTRDSSHPLRGVLSKSNDPLEGL